MYKKMAAFTLCLLVVSMLFIGCQANENGGAFTVINHETAMEMINFDPYIIVLDVRSPGEHAQRRVNNSVLFPIDTINETTAAEIIPAKDTIVILYCASGNRSRRAALELSDLGYTNVYDMGGIPNWED